MAGENTKQLTAISKHLKGIKSKLEKIRGQAESIRKTNKKGFQDVDESITENTKAQAEMKMMDHMSKVHSALPQIDAQKKRIEREKQELQERTQQIEERYQDKHEELQQKAEERIRNLGEHIFRIMEEEFEKGIEKPYLEHITPTWNQIALHNEKIKEEAAEQIQGRVEEVNESIDKFIDRRHELLSKVEEHKMEKKFEREETLQIPFWTVEIEKNGETVKKAIAPSKVEKSDKLTGRSYRELKGFSKPVKRLKNRGAETKKVEKIDRDEIVEEVSEEGENYLSILDAGEEAEKAMDEEIKVKEEV